MNTLTTAEILFSVLSVENLPSLITIKQEMESSGAWYHSQIQCEKHFYTGLNVQTTVCFFQNTTGNTIYLLYLGHYLNVHKALEVHVKYFMTKSHG